MGLKLSPGCCTCPPACGTIVVTCQTYNVGTGVATALSGADVTVKLGSTVIGTCTTTGGGSCSISIPSAGTYTVIASKASASIQTQTVSLAATCTTNNITLQWIQVNSSCCSLPVPGSLYFSDGMGTVSLTGMAITSSSDFRFGKYVWRACYTRPASQCFQNCLCTVLTGTPNCGCLAGVPTRKHPPILTGSNVNILVELLCVAGTPSAWFFGLWAAACDSTHAVAGTNDAPQFNLCPFYLVDGFFPSYCSNPVGGPGSLLIGSGGSSLTLNSCSPFSISVTFNDITNTIYSSVAMSNSGSFSS